MFADEWTFTLKSGVVFQDGTPFNAEAVKYNVERILDPATRSGEMAAHVGPVERVEMVDRHHRHPPLRGPVGDGPRRLPEGPDLVSCGRGAVGHRGVRPPSGGRGPVPSGGVGAQRPRDPFGAGTATAGGTGSARRRARPRSNGSRFASSARRRSWATSSAPATPISP